MVAMPGRRIKFRWDGVEIPGVREKSAALSGEAIDVSADDSNGWRELLSEPGQNQVDISLSGVTKNDRLRRDWFAGARTKPAEIEYEDGAILSGTFFLVSHNDTGPYNDAATFEASIQSTGVVTYAPAP